MTWQRLFENPLFEWSRHVDKREAAARRALIEAGWSSDDGVLKGQGYYKMYGPDLLYITDDEGEHPQVGRQVVVGYYIFDEDEGWWEDRDAVMSLKKALSYSTEELARTVLKP